MKKVLATIVLLMMFALTLAGCAGGNWQKAGFDTALPADLNADGWYLVNEVDFRQIDNLEELQAEGWTPSPHGRRNYEFWCDDMIEYATPEGLVVHSNQTSELTCPHCKEIIEKEIADGKRKKEDTYVFTSGIETRRMTADGKSEMLFEQAFGYFETTVKVPRGEGMWSAFWLQSDQVSQIGHQGKDGSEIDVFESSFMKENPTKTGSAIHYDAYNPPFYRCGGNVTDFGKNLYDGEFHKYALKWTPDEYVMYVDGKAVWATNYGGVSKTKEFLRLTVEIRDNNWGPYGQKIGKFSNSYGDKNDFVIQDVKIYQNKNFEKFIKSKDDFKDMKTTYIALISVAGVVGIIVLAVGVFFGARFVIKKSKSKKIATQTNEIDEQ